MLPLCYDEKLMIISALKWNNEAKQFHQLIDSIRTENQEKGFLTDDEIQAEIAAYRNEKRQVQAWIAKKELFWKPTS